MSIFDDDSPRNRMDEEFEEEEKLAVPLTGKLGIVSGAENFVLVGCH